MLPTGHRLLLHLILHTSVWLIKRVQTTLLMILPIVPIRRRPWLKVRAWLTVFLRRVERLRLIESGEKKKKFASRSDTPH